MWTDNVHHAKRFQRPSLGNEVGKTLETKNEYIDPRNRRNEFIIQLDLDYARTTRDRSVKVFLHLLLKGFT